MAVGIGEVLWCSYDEGWLIYRQGTSLALLIFVWEYLRSLLGEQGLRFYHQDAREGFRFTRDMMEFSGYAGRIIFIRDTRGLH